MIFAHNFAHNGDETRWYRMILLEIYSPEKPHKYRLFGLHEIR